VAIATVVVIVTVSAFFPRFLKPLSREGGVMEMLSLVCWAVAMWLAGVAFLKQRTSPDRLAAGWTGLLALLAFLRELDLHVALNPEVLGPYGVRYRIDWWLDGRVSFWLKLGWAVAFLALLFALLYPPWALRQRIFTLARQADPMVGLFFLAIAMSMIGFVFDDLLRKTKFFSVELRQTAEETSEMLGAAAFMASAVLRCPRSIFQRLRLRALKPFFSRDRRRKSAGLT
jgi:hypothetical protein